MRPRHSVFLLTLLGVTAYLSFRSQKTFFNSRFLDRAVVSRSLAPSFQSLKFPATVELPKAGSRETYTGHVNYTLQAPAQAGIEKLFEAFRPDYGAFVAIDAQTGKILALTSYTRDVRKDAGNLALRATFPAASIFKMVTAAAAIDSQNLGPDTVVAFNGRSHTLYKKNVGHTQHNRWTRYISLREAFGKSVNTVFAKLGIFYVGPEHLQSYADKFYFNRALPGDLPVERAIASIPNNDQWALAEISSGFNQGTTLSPLQGALMAAAVVNDGVMMEPALIQSLHDGDGNLLYEAQSKVLSVTMAPESSRKLRILMEETVERGTSRKSFRQIAGLKKFSHWDFGGKTGSLDGNSPKGRYDWFVGYASRAKQKIAVAALTINEDKWRVKSSYLAGKFLEEEIRRREKAKDVAFSRAKR